MLRRDGHVKVLDFGIAKLLPQHPVATGFIPYPVFERTTLLDRIRQSPDFAQFMAETKATVDGYRREFGR